VFSIARKQAAIMPLTFKSQATGDLVMLKAHAEALLSAMGKSDLSKGILVPADMPGALAVLKALPDDARRGSQEASDDAGEPVEPKPEPAFADEAVSLRQRAWPLIQMIERAHAADKPIVWGV